MSSIGIEIAVVIALILIGGAFNSAEIALISLRESQVKHLAETRGVRGQRLARLLADPNRFLAAIQIGVTVTTMLSSALGAATIAGRVSDYLQSLGMSPTAAGPTALLGITLILVFITLVLGELTPKRVALQRRESIALLASGPLTALAQTFRPVVWLLGRATNGAVRLLGGDPHAYGEVISEEELQSLVAAHESLSMVERRVISEVFAAEDTLVREVMVARPDVEFLPGSMTLSRAAKQTEGRAHSRYPVIGRDADDVIGVAHIIDILATNHPLGRAATVADVAAPVTALPGTKNVLGALHEMRAKGEYLAVVVDEYGGTDGIVTVEDLVEEIVGEMAYDEIRRGGDDNGFADEVDGRLNLDDFSEETGLELPSGPYDTAAGFIMARLGRVPRVGDVVVLADTRRREPEPAPAADDVDPDDPAQEDPAQEDPTPDDIPMVRLTVLAMEGRRVSRIGVDSFGADEPGSAPGADRPDVSAPSE